MFEHTLAGTIPSERSNRFGPVSAALVIHVGILLAVVAVSVLTLRPIPNPQLPMAIVFPTPPPLIEETPVLTPPAPRAGGRSDDRPAPVQPLPTNPPVTVPDDSVVLDPVASIASADAPADSEGSSLGVGPPGDGEGSGLGPGSGDGSDPTGDGPGGTGIGSGPVALGPGVAAPRLIVKVQPDYPAIARRSRLEGEVVLRAVVGPDGSVSTVAVVRSTNRLFDGAAIDAVRQWRYSPPSQDGRPVSVWFEVVVKFRLR